jgi:hypothetical protein
MTSVGQGRLSLTAADRAWFSGSQRVPGAGALRCRCMLSCLGIHIRVRWILVTRISIRYPYSRI